MGLSFEVQKKTNKQTVGDDEKQWNGVGCWWTSEENVGISQGFRGNLNDFLVDKWSKAVRKPFLYGSKHVQPWRGRRVEGTLLINIRMP